MSTYTLRNLLRAGGVNNPVAGMSFKNDMPGAPLPSGRSFNQYKHASLTTNVGPNIVGVKPNVFTISWLMDINPARVPGFLFDIGPRSTAWNVLNLSNDNTPSPSGPINISNSSITWFSNTSQVQWDVTLTNSRVVPALGPVGSGNAFDVFDLQFSVRIDPYFNGWRSVLLEGIQMEPTVGTGPGPGLPPYSINFDESLNLVTITIRPAFFGLNAGAEIQLSLESDFSTLVGSGGVYSTSSPPGTSFTLYGRARQNPGDPWSFNELQWTDPRPGV